jgi:hypothetical protein
MTSELKTHQLAFIKWYKSAPNQQTRFYTSIDYNEKSSNIELWQNESYDIERDCLIPIYYLFTGKHHSSVIIVSYNNVLIINFNFRLL